jgi:hypothetical protein
MYTSEISMAGISGEYFYKPVKYISKGVRKMTINRETICTEAMPSCPTKDKCVTICYPVRDVARYIAIQNRMKEITVIINATIQESVEIKIRV